jgi:hypothetical protein
MINLLKKQLRIVLFYSIFRLYFWKGEFIMPIPQDILSVERPTNTVVTVYGKDKTPML